MLSSSWLLPKIHGARVELALGEVVERAVIQTFQDEMQLLIGRQPGTEPLSVGYLYDKTVI